MRTCPLNCTSINSFLSWNWLWTPIFYEYSWSVFKEIGYCIPLCFAFYYWLQLSCTSLFLICCRIVHLYMSIDSLTGWFLFINLFLDFCLHICVNTCVETSADKAWLLRTSYRCRSVWCQLNWAKRLLNFLLCLPGMMCRRTWNWHIS